MNEETLAWREYRKERQEKRGCNLETTLRITAPLEIRALILENIWNKRLPLSKLQSY